MEKFNWCCIFISRNIVCVYLMYVVSDMGVIGKEKYNMLVLVFFIDFCFRKYMKLFVFIWNKYFFFKKKVYIIIIKLSKILFK